jgi:hypothetical protein
MLNCYFGLTVYLTQKTTTVVTSISRAWLRTLFIPWGHQSLFRENISLIEHIIPYTSKEATVFLYILFKICNDATIVTSH